MDFRSFLKENTVILDGGMGTLLQKAGLKAGELPERWNLTHNDEITAIHRSYFDAGSNVVYANTFGANILKFDEAELEEIVKAALLNAKRAREESEGGQEKFVALDIGPTGKLLSPLGDLDFERAVEIFATTVRLGVKYGADIIAIETMNDSYETKAALLAAKENCDLPVIVTNAYGGDGKLMTGATAAATLTLLESMGADAIGANCSLGPKQLVPVMEELLEKASVPVVMKANAGLPVIKDGKTLYDVTAEEFAETVAALVKKGVRVIGGCCGTTPEYIGKLYEKTKNIAPVPLTEKNVTAVCSYTHEVVFGKGPILIGERINPTGKKKFKEALRNNDMDYILSEGISQQEKGVHILDVNVGLPEIDEGEMLKRTVCELQAVSDLPLQIDTADACAMEKALRRVNGKPLINSVNGKRESMEAIFPLMKKYGGVVVALTLDEDGIPQTAEKRVEIAKKILKTAEEYGIGRKDIIFDTLAMAVSADPEAPEQTLEALRRIKTELNCHTSLGVSNVSFGLPNRDAVNSAFFALALSNGLSAAIMNPYSAEMMKTYFSYKALMGFDENCAEYIAASQSFVSVQPSVTAVTPDKAETGTELQKAIIKGLKDKAGEITKELLNTASPLEIINVEIIPALDKVGEDFEKNKVFLPQLLMSAEAAKSAFDKIKQSLKTENTQSKGNAVIATVKGDIHDIGKNIVKMLLENYGFNVTDLGKDVPSDEIVRAVAETEAQIVFLSALMTTTVPAMEETVRLIKEKAPFCKTVVGGAVMTREYADKMNADFYAKDAMEAVRYAEKVIG